MGTTLDIAIGLVGVYFLLSVLCSAVYEALAGIFRLRALNLAQSIEILLADRALDDLVRGSASERKAEASRKATAPMGLLGGVARAVGFVYTRMKRREQRCPLAAVVREHPLIKDLKYGWVGPSYIPSHAFVAALIDTLRHIAWSPGGDAAPRAAAAPAAAAGAAAADVAAPGTPASDAAAPGAAVHGDATPQVAAPDGAAPRPPGRDEDPLIELRSVIARMPEGSDLRRALATIVDGSVRDVQTANARLERWFNDAMDRAAGRYKRRAQLLISAVALILCVGFNADSIRMASSLSRDAAVRASVLAAAQRMASAPPRPSATESDLKRGEEVLGALAEGGGAHSRLSALDLKVTWGDVKPPEQKSFPKLWGVLEWLLGEGTVGWIRGVLDRIFSPGILITTAAASLGAPFWFDLLNKLVNLRTVGKTPTSSSIPQPPPQRSGAGSS